MRATRKVKGLQNGDWGLGGGGGRGRISTAASPDGVVSVICTVAATWYL